MKQILAIIDVQNDFITGPLGNKECEDCVPNVIKAIKSGKYDEVIITLDTHTKDYLNTQEGKKLPIEHCIKGTDGHKLVSDVEKAINENFDSSKIHIFEKETFGSRDLGKTIRDAYKNQELEIDFCGVCTGICVISNATIVKAFLPEAKIKIISDACACVTPQSHQTALDAMSLLQMEIL